jgi:integrase
MSMTPSRKKLSGANQRKFGWQTILQNIVNEHNNVRAKGTKTVSHKTRELRASKLFLIFNTLKKELGFGIEDPCNIKVKHITSLIEYWQNKGLSAGTIEQYLSYLRTFCNWIGKEGMVLAVQEYAPSVKRTYAAEKDKSFTGNEIDFWQIWQQVNVEDRFTGMQLLLIKAFGLRKREAILFKPLICDRQHSIEVSVGSKGGKARLVPICNDFQMGVLALCKNFALQSGNPKRSMAHPDRTLSQEESRYGNVMKKVGLTKGQKGVTGHGLRAEYSIDRMLEGGIVATVRGGAGLKGGGIEERAGALQVSESLGHSRLSVMPAYGGRWIVTKLRDDGGKEYYGVDKIPENATRGYVSLEESRRELQVKEHNDHANLRIVTTALNGS